MQINYCNYTKDVIIYNQKEKERIQDMFRAKVFYTIGCGLEIGCLKADTYKGLVEKVDTILNSNIIVEKIVYSYPSGKTFTKTF